jgi:hypothetical protein
VPTKKSKECIELIVHIDETLSEPKLTQLESDLCCDNGIETVHINPTRRHLMLVDYAPDLVKAADVLAYVKNKGVHAELVGGI